MSDVSAYKKLSHREHVLLRPNVYVGSAAAEPVSTWLFDKESGKMVRTDNVQYVPALLKIFDEIVVNAIDHSTRTRQRQNQGQGQVQVVKKIEVSIARETGVITVTNDGDSIPVELHDELGVYVPEMIFGHLLTSTNYDDDGGGGEARTIGGQNGIGAKACNILSLWFEVEVVDSVRHLKYTQRFEEHMASTLKPVVAKSAARRSSLSVRFLPDYGRLGMPEGRLSDDMYAMMVKRVYDATAVTDSDVAVYLDGTRIDVRSFERYVDLYIGAKAEVQRAYERPCDGWEVAACLSDGSGLQQVSFVNGVATLRGGRHVDHVVNQICRRVCDLISQRSSRKGGAAQAAPKLQYVRDNLMVFVRATVPGAAFESQSKEALTTPASRFGAKVELSEAFVDRVYRIEGLVERVVGLSGVAAEREARKTDGSKRATVSVPKLEDADWAGTAKSAQCTLILTEGDSAKASAVAGLAVVGRQRYGVFPLRGKVMNVCDLGADRVAANTEIAAIKKILGLQTGRVYSSVSELRYGRVMLMTDADTDGSHIKGLVMNLFLQLWPSLLRLEGFMCSMLTPIVKVTGFGGKDKVPLEFYNMGDFEAWKAGLDTGQGRWTSKYYKGLGTSTPEEAREWFRRMRIVAYTWEDAPVQPDHQGGGTARVAHSRESLLKAFDKRRADDRKAWLQAYDASRTLDYGRGDVTFTEFVERDLVHFSNYDVLRSIPSAVDGLKVSQRKALFGCRKRNLVTGEVRVAQLAAYVSEQACFHHGEASMQGTIVGLAQDFVGSGNNLPLLEPIGQFGTRLAGGADWASPRYIHTRLSKTAALLYPKADDAILEHIEDDGITVEPRHYLPVVPLVLVNGASGIGTGYSTTVPSHCPLEVIAAVRSRIVARQAAGTAHTDGPMLPWHRGFRGTIEVGDGGRVRSRGVLVREAATRVRVEELPVGYWTEDFKAAVDALVERSADVRSVANESTDSSARFVLTFASAASADAWMAPSEKDASVTRLEAELKMCTTKSLSTSNMHLFNAKGQIRKYETTSDILNDFFEARLDGYIRRREHTIQRLAHEAEVLRNRVLFVEAVLDGRLRLNVAPDALEQSMEDAGLCRIDEGGYDYLLSMPMASMTQARKEALDAQLSTRRSELEHAEASTPFDIWVADLDALEAHVRSLK